MKIKLLEGNLEAIALKNKTILICFFLLFYSKRTVLKCFFYGLGIHDYKINFNSTLIITLCVNSATCSYGPSHYKKINFFKII